MAEELTLMEGIYLELVQEEAPWMLRHLRQTGQWRDHMRLVAGQANQAVLEMTSSAPDDLNLGVMAREVAIEQMRQTIPVAPGPPD